MLVWVYTPVRYTILPILLKTLGVKVKVSGFQPGFGGSTWYMMSYVQPYLDHTLLGKLRSPCPLESKKIVSGSVSSSVSL